MTQEIPSLAKVYGDFFAMGAAVNRRTIDTHSELLKTHFNSVTAENEMKFESLHRTRGDYDFASADAIVDFAVANGMKVRGHTLVWHNQTPKWVFEDADGHLVPGPEVEQIQKEHMETVMGRYKDVVYAWDVVNEAISDSDDEFLRNSPWLRALGEGFIGNAFLRAHAIAPDAKLFYNDYNETHPAKRDKIYRLVKQLRSEGVPVHGIGMQGHWGLGGPSVSEIREAVELYSSLGVELQVTELDISVFEFEDRRTDLKSPTTEMMDRLAERYEEIFALFREYKSSITGVTFWGIADDSTWKDGFPVRGRKDWPLVFDVNHEPKAAFHRVVNF